MHKDTMPERILQFSRSDNAAGAKYLQSIGAKNVALYDGHLCGWGCSKASLQNATSDELKPKMEYLTIRQFLQRWGAIATICTAVLLSACSPRIYRVTFTDGSYDYYELRYKPQPGATSIEVDGETILGVQKIEKLNY